MNKSLWKFLTPDSAMTAVENVIHQKLTNLCLPRNSYINRVYELETVENERIIVKFYRPNRWTPEMILGEHAFLSTCYENDLPVIPPSAYGGKTLFMCDQIPFAIFPKKGGRAIDELTEDLWKETGRLLGRLHNLGKTMSDSRRIQWRPSIATAAHLKSLEESHVIPEDYRASFSRAVTQFIQTSDPLFENIEMFLIHGDCHFGNIIYRPGESLYVVDFDDCVVGPPVQDLWMLLPDEVENCDEELTWFREGYTVFRDFPNTTLDIIPHLKIMRQIHFASWCAMQVGEPHFAHHFPDWGTVSYWNTLVRDVMSAMLS